MKTRAKREREASVLESFTERVERLADELRLAIHWERPSILLAIYQSRYTMLDAQTALVERLQDLGQRFERYVVNADNADIPLHLSELPEDERAHTIFFVDGLQFGGREALRALNIRREFFVDHRIRVVFWLTEKEAISLPQEAPDFWRFRSRVVDFMDRHAPERAAKIGRELAWYDFEDRTLPEDTEAKIALRVALLGDLPESEATLATRTQLLFTLGGLYWAKGELDESFRYFQEAIRVAEPLDDTHMVSLCHNGLGSVYRDLGRHDEASAAYQKAIELDPKFAHPWNGLGNVYADLGRHEEASAAYQKAIELEPKYAYPWNGLGSVYRDLGRHDEAIAAFDKAIQLDPKHATSHASLAACYRKLGREAEAAEQTAIARPLMEKENEYNRACFESICGNVEEALRLLEIALEKKQTNMAWARRDPDFDFIRDDPRFKEIIGVNESSET